MRLQVILGIVLVMGAKLTLPQYLAQPNSLRKGFYAESCPELEKIVYNVMREAVQARPRDAASILRLFFHDCFVQGCDGSILLDDEPGFQGEKGAVPNKNSARAFYVIDFIKSSVEAFCPGVVSCADILALASRDAVVLTNGPYWDVFLGRKDARKGSLSLANSSIPNPASNLTTLVSMFQAQGLSSEDLVVLSGAHTIGFARCTNFKQRLYNQSGTHKPDPNLSFPALLEMKKGCPPFGADNNTHSLDKSPFLFDTSYFEGLVQRAALLNSDQVLQSTIGSPTTSLVESLANDQTAFFDKFPLAMIKMGNISPLTGSKGEIRRNCRVRN
ncbi:hypothetical protein GOP47_0012768 [Adiantum capillus-veneris]|uniref:Peroxidase n=1 Tax=Adiantum capillus-veneris TaxID=13818 RepID=A0A9D4URU4_ADICA|nr:hypothetical protein GOP47_0012768 [Adiantum capillus-veneris]